MGTFHRVWQIRCSRQLSAQRLADQSDSFLSLFAASTSRIPMGTRWQVWLNRLIN
jgi:hypothetical protein